MALPVIATGALRIGSMFVRGSSTFVKGASRGVGRSGGMLRRAILKKTKVKRENIVSRKVFNKRIKEKRRRMSKEQALETFKTRGKSGAPNVPGKSFLQRILDFIGILLVGWLVDKLPKIIKWVQNLIERIRKLVDSLKSFIKNLGDWFKSIGSIVSAGWDNIRNFDFTDQSGKLKKAMTDMENAFKGMQKDLDNAKNAINGSIKETEKPPTTTLTTAGEGAASINDPNARALLNAIAEAEGTSGYQNQGYNTQFTGTQFRDLSSHPRQIRSSNGYASDAAGRYQFLSTTWDSVMGGAMTPERQDKAALKLVSRRGVDIKNGLSMNEIYRLGGEWASIEGGPSMRKGGSYGGQVKYSAESFLRLYQKYGGKVQGAGDGSKARGSNQTSAYQTAVNVGKLLNRQGYDVWQHPDFNVNSGYTGSGKERVMRRSYNSYHNYGEALDVPVNQRDENGNIVYSPEKLDKLYSFLNTNRSKFNIAELKWKDDSNHFDHLHVSFKGGGGTPIKDVGNIEGMPVNIPDMGANIGKPKNTIIIMEEEAPPMMMGGGSRGSSPVIVMGSSLNSIMKRKLLTDLAYT